jgi:hypothetical protein
MLVVSLPKGKMSRTNYIIVQQTNVYNTRDESVDIRWQNSWAGRQDEN